MLRRLAAGAAGGLAGGVVFGAMMQMMGMVAMIGGLVGQPDPAVGWLVHLVIAALLGLGYALTFGLSDHSWSRGALFGLLYGAIWWVLGPLLLMPLLMGMPPFQIDQQAVMSLVGHGMYGLVLGLVHTAVLRPQHEPTAA